MDPSSPPPAVPPPPFLPAPPGPGGEADGFRYQGLAAQVAEQIARGVYRPGERLPSVRRLRAHHRVSVATAVQAYLALENQGLIVARPRSGFFVRAHPRLDRSPTEPPVSRSARGPARVRVGELRGIIFEHGARPDFVPFGTVSPSAALLPTAKLARIVGAAARQHPETTWSYDPPPGCPALRRELARRALDWGCHLAPDDFLLTVGATEAISLSLRAVTSPGDVVAIESPTYFGILQCLEHLGLHALEISTHPQDGLDLDELAAALGRGRPRLAAAVVVTNFSNPLGSCLSDHRKQRLVSLLSAHRVPLVEDDLYGDLHFGPDRPRVAKAFDREGWVLLCGSVSKTLAPGWRVGWVAAGARFAPRVRRLKTTSTLATPGLLPLATAEFLRHGGFDRYLRTLRATYAHQVEQVRAAVGRHFPEGVRVTSPRGGFVLWVELPRTVDAMELTQRALAEKISVAPGPLFSARDGFRHYVRLSCGHPWSPALDAGVATLGRLVRELT